MSLKQFPWHTKPLALNPVETGSLLCDAIGNRIAIFPDYRDAELVIQRFENFSKLEQQVENLESKIESLQEEINDLST